ncbi:MAG: Hsp20/alpha crystallin family protein [Chitinophagaceae bacterium]
MTIVKRNGNLHNSFPALFNDFFTRNMFNWGESDFSNTGTTIPAVNIKETNEGFEVEMAAPGMKKNDFKIELEGNLLTISSETSNQTGEKEGDRYSRREFSYQSFQRSFTLAKDVLDAEKIKAKYEDGMLHLSIPKKEEAKQKPPRLIQIS